MIAPFPITRYLDLVFFVNYASDSVHVNHRLDRGSSLGDDRGEPIAIVRRYRVSGARSGNVKLSLRAPT